MMADRLESSHCNGTLQQPGSPRPLSIGCDLRMSSRDEAADPLTRISVDSFIFHVRGYLFHAVAVSRP